MSNFSLKAYILLFLSINDNGFIKPLKCAWHDTDYFTGIGICIFIVQIPEALKV